MGEGATKYSGRDLNPHALRHQNLNLACLPISPPEQKKSIKHKIEDAVCVFSFMACQYLLEKNVLFLETIDYRIKTNARSARKGSG